MDKAIATIPSKPDLLSRINEFQTIAKLFAQSNLFTDAKGEAQCFVKILAGAELGIPPFTAMNSFHIIQGKPTMTAGTIAARVKASGRYDYQVLEKTSVKCSVQFFENGKPVHVETWDAARAQKAGVQNMGKFPDAMLFARCITAGARAVAPDIVGQFYTPEEMGATVNAEGDVIQGESRPVDHIETTIGDAPVDPLEKSAAKLGGTIRTEPITQAPANKVAVAGESLDAKRARLVATLNKANADLASAGLLDVLDETKAASNDNFAAIEAKIARAEAAIAAARLPA